MTTAMERDAGTLDGLREVIDDASAGRVFATPIRQGGLVVLPVARLRGCNCAPGGAGTGAGTGEAAAGRHGTGASAKALGVFVISNGKVSWRPAIDVNKAVLGAQVVAVVAMVTIRAVVKSRRGKPCS